MKRYPKSTPDEAIQVERIHGVEMKETLALRPGESRWVRVRIARLKDDPEVILWTDAIALDVEDF